MQYQEDAERSRRIGDFLGEMRDRTFKKYDAFSVGEVFDEKDEEIPDFIGDNGYFSSMFDFEETIWGASDKGWYDCKQITPDAYKKCCFTTQRKIGDIGFVSNIIENHDELVVSADISRKVTAVTQVRRCLAV